MPRWGKRWESPEARFWSKVQKTDTCWNWKAACTQFGYGQFYVSRQQAHTSAHRYSWLLHYGEIPEGLFVCHHCDNPRCVNPSHLFLGTAKDNTMDMHKKGRQYLPQTNRQLIICDGCGQEFRVLNCRIKDGCHHFCSWRCCKESWAKRKDAICSKPNCNRQVRSEGLCASHYAYHRYRTTHAYKLHPYKNLS